MKVQKNNSPSGCSIDGIKSDLKLMEMFKSRFSGTQQCCQQISTKLNCKREVKSPEK